MMANMDPITRTDPLGKFHVSNCKSTSIPHASEHKVFDINPKSNSLKNSLLITEAYTQFFSKKRIVIATFHLNQQYHKWHKCFLLDKYKVAVSSKN